MAMYGYRATPRVTRRYVLTGLLAGGTATALLAACGGTTSSTAPSSAAATSAATPAGAGAAATPAATTASAAAAQAATPAAAPTISVQSAATPAPAAKGAPGSVTEMAIRAEWPADKVMKQFEQQSNIKINFVNQDLVHMIAMTAAGSPPDMYRVQAATVPYYSQTLKMAKDLTANFKLSKALGGNDLLSANKNYWYDGFTPFQGNIYGMVKDWSPDLSLFLNTEAFKQAGVAVPATDKVLTYQDLADYAKKLTKKVGSRTLIMGYSGCATSWFDRLVEAMLNTQGKTMWPTFDALSWDTTEAKAVLSYWFDLAKAGAMYSPISPQPTWAGPEMIASQLAITQYGYWFSGELNPAKDKQGIMVNTRTVMLSAPTWGPQHQDPTITATGDMIHARTKSPEAIWSVFEWFHTGEPALERARSGWGVPALKSLLKDMPVENPFQKQVSTILQGELKISSVAIKYNPYLPQSENVAQNAILTSYQKNLEPALKGQMTFDQLVHNVQTEVNTAIKRAKEGMK